MGQDSDSDPRIRLRLGLIRLSKDYLFTQFLFSSISNKLSAVERKERLMNTIALTIILIVRVLVPITVLISLGEWVQRREKNYWRRM
jgi:Mg2+/Co2+ transporter CorB